MPLRAGSTYVIPKRGVVNTKRKTFSGKGQAPGGSRKVKAPAIATVPVVTTSPTGHVTTQNFPSPRAASQAKRQARSSQRRVRRVEAQQASALAFHRRTQQRASQPAPGRPGGPSAKTTVPKLTPVSAASSPVVPRPPSYKPPKFQGAKTAGTPTLGALQKAQSKGLLKTNKRGFVTTPAVRKVSKALKKAQSEDVRLTGPLTPGQKVFAKQVAKRTGLNPRVVAAQALAEESGAYATQREAEGNHDWLNIGYFDSGPGQLTHSGNWSNPRSAARSTARFLKGKEYGASEGIKAIIPESKGRGPGAQISAIASSGWATSPTYKQSIEGTYAQVGTTGKPVPKKLVRRAEQLGLRTSPAQKQQDYLKLFGKQVAMELHLVKKGDYEKGPGKLVVGSSDVHYGHEPEIAARLKLLSAKLGKPIYIISGHRTPQHSVEVGGFANDPHTEGKAADIGVGSALRDSAGTITEAQYESVGLHRPYYPASSAEINHVELLNGGTPATGGGSSSAAVTTGTSTALPSGAISSYAAATGQSPKVVRERLKRGKLGPQQILKKLKELGAGLGEGSEKPSEGSESKASVLAELERRYGSKAA